MINESVDRPGIKYRVMSYFVGTVFAVLSYAIGVWAYSSESAAFGQRPLPSIWLQIKDILPRHPFSFIGWGFLLTGLSVIIGYLFDRQAFYHHRAERKANVDGLTGAYNHRYFQDRLTSEVERAQRYGRSISVVMFDLDNFKLFNDRCGHQEGDRLLKWFADICKTSIRSMDILARYGGEEFVLILPEAGVEEANAAANRIREAIDQMAPNEFPSAPRATVSAGVASYPEHGQTRHTLILNADTALYFAKQTGKNRVAVYEESFKKMYRATSERLKALLCDNNMGAIEALSSAVDAKDHYTRGHSDAVTRYSVALAEKLGLSDNDRENVKAAALLHDIGKIGTPDSILQKPGPLKMDEWQVIEDHPMIGSQILEKVQQMGSIVPGVRHHHERYDGLGYPNGLAGKNIPLLARIISLADSYDAMVSDRTYRKALSPEEALAEIKRCSGTQFDPELVDMFVDAVQADLDQQKESEPEKSDQSEAA